MLARLIATIFVAAALTASLSAATVTVVPNLFNGKLPVISKLMPDGKSIMGVAGDEVFRWTPHGGRVVLGSLGSRVLATAISADGTTVVGRRVSFSDQEAIRWTVGEGLTVLPRPDEFPHNPFPTHVSDDGSIVYGTAHTRFIQPILDLWTLGEITNPDFDDIHTFGDAGVFRWDSSGGSKTLPAWTNSPFLQDISGNGLIATGTINRMPVIWTETAGALQLNNLPDPFFSAWITELSADGKTVIGGFFPTQFGHRHAFRWSQDQGFQPLTDITEAYSDAWAVSGDGQIILGHKQGPGDLAFDFVWRAEHGIQRLVDYFAAHGLTLPFEGIHSASQMSRDGLVFLGATTQTLIGDDGAVSHNTIPWIVDLNAAVPEPTTLVAFLTGILLTANYRRATRATRRRINATLAAS